MAIDLCREARPSGLAARLHEFSEQTVAKEGITSMKLTRSQEHSPAVGHSTTGNTELEHLFDFDLQAAPVIPPT